MAPGTVGDVLEGLGGKRTLPRGARSPRDLVELIRAGLPSRALQALLERLELDAKDASAALGISARTLSRKRNGSERLSAAESDRVARLARIFAIATHALGDQERARGWLGDPNRALGGVRPLDLMDTEIGTREVEDVLGRIAFGVYS